MSQRVGSRDARLRSNGCLSCIRMKVKCDETKPHCQRCQSANRTCPGYRDKTAFVFWVQSTSNTPSSSRTTSPPDRTLVVQQASPSSPLSTNWQQCAVSHFFHNFILPSSNGFPGYFEFLPQLYRANPNALYLHRSVEALSWASLAQVRHMGDSYLRIARRSYGLALHELGIALSNPTKASAPDVLATTALLWQYDIVMGEDHLSSRSPHRQGQIEILRRRMPQMPDGEKWINRSVLAGVQMQHLDPSGPSPTDLPAPLGPSAPFGPGILLMEALLPQSMSACAAVDRLVQSPTSSAVDIASSIGELQSLRHQFQTWEVGLPQDWRYKIIPNPLPMMDETYFPPTVIILPMISAAGIWTACWLARLSVLQSLIQVQPLALAVSMSQLSMQDLCTEVMSIVLRMCSTVPYLLGQITAEGKVDAEGNAAPVIGAFFATRAMYISAKVSTVSEKQLEWILGQMKYIGHKKGIRQALVLREEVMRSR